MPHVQVLHEKYADNPNVVILAMNVGDENERMATWWAEQEYSFPTLNDADELTGQYGIKAFPSTILIGPDGRVLEAIVGSAHDLEEQLTAALESLEEDAGGE